MVVPAFECGLGVWGEGCGGLVYGGGEWEDTKIYWGRGFIWSL